MKIEKNFTATLSENDVKEIIADHFKKEGYNVTSNDVSISVGKELRGYGMCEYETVCFRSASVKIKMN